VVSNIQTLGMCRGAIMQTQGLPTQEFGGDSDINWVTAFFMAAFHIGAIAALFFFSWKVLLLAIGLWWISGSLGIGMGYHRLLTHRGYRTPKWVEYFLTFCGTLSLEGGPIFWVATHRIHHRFTDQEGDPHSPRDGKW
jgi:sn-1 stearoyl-lipid 9-desaturase